MRTQVWVLCKCGTDRRELRSEGNCVGEEGFSGM